MSLNPDLAPTPAPAPHPVEVRASRTWRNWLLGILFALFTYAIGLFLVVFPWTDFWAINYFEEAFPMLRDLWYEPSFRGAITGLGFVNIYIACWQVVYSLRKS
ncbi:MAG TPA: hypothetical protein VGN17_15490 [Bryobacteraceae bacterium]